MARTALPAAGLPVLALGAVLLLLSACGGGDDNGDVTASGSEGGGAAGTSLALIAKDGAFDKDRLSAPQNAGISVSFDNQDRALVHNVAFYRTSDFKEPIFVGELFAGPGNRTFEFQSPGRGTYFFRCDTHPDTMKGTFNVQ